MRFSLKMALLVAVAAGLCYLGNATAADDVDPKDVKGCMAFQNKVRTNLGKQAKAKDPNWADIQKQTEDWVKVAAVLEKQSPPKGDAKSWKEQTDKYVLNVKAVDTAANKKDVEGLTKGLATVQGSCMGCHSKHKGK